MNTLKFAKKLAIPLFVALAYGPSQGFAQSILGSALDDFAVFGKTLVSSAPAFGPSIITGGDVGSLTAITGSYNIGAVLRLPASSSAAGSDLGPIGSDVTGDFYAGGATANGALAAMAVNQSGGALALGTTFAPGVYHYVTGDLAAGQTIILDGSLAGLNGTTGSNSVWVFRFDTTLTTATTSNFLMTGVDGAAGVGLYWSTGTTAALNGNTWAGNVLSLTDITSDGGLTMTCGGLYAGTAVTLIGDSISSSGCGNSAGFDRVAAIPEPETYAMMLAGLGMMGFVARRRQRNLAAAA